MFIFYTENQGECRFFFSQSEWQATLERDDLYVHIILEIYWKKLDAPYMGVQYHQCNHATFSSS